MKDIKLIIFDLDGTLVDAYGAITRSFNFTMQKLNYPKLDNLIIRRQVGWGDENLLKPFVNSKDLPRALKIYRVHHKKALLRHSRLFPYVKILLRLLKHKGYKLAIASNRPTRFSWILIRHLGIDKYFDFILCADKLQHIKPHPEILNKVINKFHLLPRQTLYVGDMAIDVQAAHRAGVESVIVTTGSSSKQEIKKERPYRLIGKIIELLKILSV